jgi:hypothetical protein
MKYVGNIGASRRFIPSSDAGVRTQIANDTFLPVKHLFVNGHTVADITGATGSCVINYDFVDHLGSTEVTVVE